MLWLTKNQLESQLKALAFVLSMAFSVALVGCGFHLKTAAVWPVQFQKIRVYDAQGTSSLASSLSVRLTQQQRELVDQDPDLTITIVSQSSGQREIASTLDGRNREYVTSLRAIISVTDKKGDFLLSNAEFTSSRELQINEANVLINGSDVVKREMENQVIDTILRRIEAKLKSQTFSSPKTNIDSSETIEHRAENRS